MCIPLLATLEKKQTNLEPGLGFTALIRDHNSFEDLGMQGGMRTQGVRFT